MSDKQLPVPIVGNNSKRVSGLSSKKVFSAFKSPCRPNSQLSPKVNSSASSHCDTPRPIVRKRKTALSSSFVSPLKHKVIKTEHSLDDIAELQSHIKTQEKEIEELRSEGLKETDLKLYIEKLHEYNEIKDVAQMVIGRLAVQLETTTRDVYSKFELNPED